MKPDLQIKYIRPSELKPFPGNPRKNEDAIDPVLRSMEEFGFINPIVARKADGMIVAGYTRWKAALKANMQQVPVVFVDLTEDDAKRFNIADNRLGEIATGDIDLLAVMLREFEEKGLDISVTGFSDDDVMGMLDIAEPEPEHTGTEDDVPPIPATPITQPGDIWELGVHRLICGDSTDPNTIARLTNGIPADMIWTDPPYNVDYTSNKARNDGKTSAKLANDHLPDVKFREFLTAIFSAAYTALTPGGAIYVAHADRERFNNVAALEAAGFLHKQTLIWAKQQFVLSRQDYNWQHEPILYGWKPGAAHRWFGEFNKSTLVHREPPIEPGKMTKAALVEYMDRLIEQARTASDLLEVPRPMRSDLHPTMKPVALVERMILNSSRRRHLVLDPCAGSGTTLMACETTKRACRTAELEPGYCDVIVQRWEEYTGQEARRI